MRGLYKRYDWKSVGTVGSRRSASFAGSTRQLSVASQDDWLARHLGLSANGCGVIDSHIIQSAPTAGDLGISLFLGTVLTPGGIP